MNFGTFLFKISSKVSQWIFILKGRYIFYIGLSWINSQIFPFALWPRTHFIYLFLSDYVGGWGSFAGFGSAGARDICQSLMETGDHSGAIDSVWPSDDSRFSFPGSSKELKDGTGSAANRDIRLRNSEISRWKPFEGWFVVFVHFRFRLNSVERYSS